MDPRCQHLPPLHHTFHTHLHHSRNMHHRLISSLIIDPRTSRHDLDLLTDLKLLIFPHFLQATVRLLSQKVQKKCTPHLKSCHKLKEVLQAAHLLATCLNPSSFQTKSLVIPDSRKPHQVIQPQKPFLGFHTPTK